MDGPMEAVRRSHDLRWAGGEGLGPVSAASPGTGRGLVDASLLFMASCHCVAHSEYIPVCFRPTRAIAL